jgi:hypothetical protein
MTAYAAFLLGFLSNGLRALPALIAAQRFFAAAAIAFLLRRSSCASGRRRRPPGRWTLEMPLADARPFGGAFQRVNRP